MSTLLTPSAPTAQQRINATTLEQSQLQLMGKDVDLEAFNLQMRGVVGADLLAAITAADVDRSIEGSSILTVSVQDHDRKLLRSGRLHGAQDVQIDGLWFRLSAISKGGDSLRLTFEDREIAVLRTYDKIIKQTQATSRSHVTRAEFILRLLKEVKQFPIRYVIPELHRPQPIEQTQDTAVWGTDPPASNSSRGYGIPAGTTVTVKGVKMSANQRRIANIILNTGASMVLPRKLLVISMMVAIQENNLTNGTSPDNPSHIGVFQQDPAYWPATGDVATDAAEFFKRLAANNATHPNAAYYQLAEDTQHSGDAQAYAQWRTEAERIVTTYGLPNGSAADANNMNNWAGGQGDYEFYRGEPPTNGFRKWQKENSWDCIQRLAAEVNWRAFFVSGVFYYMFEDELFKSKPIAIVDEDTEGVEGIDGDLTPNKRASHRGYEYENQGSCTVTCRIGRWQAPPGSVVQLQNMGPWDGRWLVSTVSRSLYDSLGTIELKKPLPKLPEPGQSNVPSNSQNTTWTTPAQPSTSPRKGAYGALVSDSLKFAGVDQGIDFTGTGTIYAPAAGVVVSVNTGTGWPGHGTLIVLDIGGGRYIYIAEDALPVSGLHAGQQFDKGDPIATLNSTYPGTEIGWCDKNGTPLAPLHPDPHGPKPEGANFNAWILGGGG